MKPTSESETPAPPADPRAGLAPENAMVLVLAALLVGLLVGHALGRRQGLTINQVALPGEIAAHAGMGGDADAEAMIGDGPMPKAPENLAEAMAMVEKMGEVDAATLIDMGHQKYDNGKWLLAVAFYEGALRQTPDLPDVWCDLGAAYRELGEYAEAMRCFDETIKRQPEHLQAWFNRGVVNTDLKKPAEARAAYGKVVALAGDNPLGAQAKEALAKLGE